MNNLKPMMDDESIKAFEGELLLLKEKQTVEQIQITNDYDEPEEINILEWGSGMSTIYFTKCLFGNSINFRWDSIEHDAKWYIKLHKLNQLSQVKLHLFMEGNPADKNAMAKARMKQYINFPRSLCQHYDLIFVDGRRRPECMEMAKRFLKKDGILLLHDAQREAYQETMKQFKGEFLTKHLWKGIVKT